VCLPILSCSSWGLQCAAHRWSAGGLLHHHFTLTPCGAVYFLLHFPWGYPHSGFPSNLLLGARTFLKQEDLLPATDSFAVVGTSVQDLAADLATDEILSITTTALCITKIEQCLLGQSHVTVVTGRTRRSCNGRSAEFL